MYTVKELNSGAKKVPCTLICGHHRSLPAQKEAGRGRGVRPHSGERSEGVGGAVGRLILFNTATYQELLDCNHSKAQTFKGVETSGKEGRYMLGCV